MARLARRLVCLSEAVYARSRPPPEVDTKHGVSLQKLKIDGLELRIGCPGWFYLPLGVAIDVDGYESEARWFCGREAEERLSG